MKRNPTDATLRNINALKKRVAKLETRLTLMAQMLDIRFITVPPKKKATKARP